MNLIGKIDDELTLLNLKKAKLTTEYNDALALLNARARTLLQIKPFVTPEVEALLDQLGILL